MNQSIKAIKRETGQASEGDPQGTGTRRCKRDRPSDAKRELPGRSTDSRKLAYHEQRDGTDGRGHPLDAHAVDQIKGWHREGYSISRYAPVEVA